MYNCIMFKASTKAFFKIKAIFILAILLSSISIAILVWNYSLEPKDIIESDFNVEQPNIPESQDPHKGPTDPEVPIEPSFSIFHLPPNAWATSSRTKRSCFLAISFITKLPLTFVINNIVMHYKVCHFWAKINTCIFRLIFNNFNVI